ncbi:hypothetical protein [Phenylobacterium sp.]|jgi:hypothetical protein|uniref:hypothetical protein n=1 Tax=Phenylobacterium sp. TaxID=1871053 RepID=UPI002E3373A3|nr:hypothetical protein [Phenylobacterium sp.]HEX3364579.1 hypothetical protein [Phenylobacterium sp.]
MIDPNDLYVFETSTPLGPAGNNFGTSVIRYEIQRYRDVRNLGVTLGYTLVCRHRVIIPNASAYAVGPSSVDAFSDYPAAIVNTIGLTVNNGGTVLLREIFPRILNAAVSTSTSAQAGQAAAQNVQHSSGSNTSQTNTFGVSVSGGFFGEMPMGNISLEYQHGWESGSFKSSAHGSDTSRNSSAASSETMSVKDWSSYGYADVNDMSSTWVWGQTYPWDVLQYNYTSDSSSIELPSFVQGRLLDSFTDPTSGATTNLVLPPSQISLFGADFTMKAGWLIEFPQGVTESETVTVTHNTSYYTASHSLNGDKILATLQAPISAATSQFSVKDLDLSTYGLDRIADASAGNGAAIGFASDRFTYGPDASSSFKIVSAANNLEVTGQGFGPGLNTTFSAPVSLTVEFKILDSATPYALLLMHWIGAQSSPMKLTVAVNGVSSDVIYIDAQEGQGAQKNVSALDLRNLDFTSINYHDYLVLGLNQITIAVEPVDPTAANDYTLFALAIGQA